jgi:serine/threonine protein kinase
MWAFGCTLLHMLTGTPPWAGFNIGQIAMRVGARGQAPTLPVALPPLLTELIASCVVAAPDARPSALQLLTQLQDAMAGLIGERLQLPAAGGGDGTAVRALLGRAAARLQISALRATVRSPWRRGSTLPRSG